MRRPFASLLACAVVALGAFAGTADAKIPVGYKNCTNLNKSYPHGVGRVGAHDHTSGKAVTNFKRSNKVYALAIKFNRGLDRDHDGIACEKV